MLFALMVVTARTRSGRHPDTAKVSAMTRTSIAGISIHSHDGDRMENRPPSAVTPNCCISDSSRNHSDTNPAGRWRSGPAGRGLGLARAPAVHER
jgi:hypothetical protein